MTDYERADTDVVSVMPLPDDQSKRPCLVQIAGANTGATYPVEHAAVLGRDKEAGICIQGEGISRLHCQFAIQEKDEVFIKDLDSKNGTLVNNKPLTDETPLKEGDRIQVGSITVLKLVFQDELEAAFQSRMFDSALRDGLTGLYNRRYLDDRLQAEYAWAKRNGAALTLCLIDVDNFKQINDTFGHTVGDAVLKAVADLLTGSVRTEDTVCRYGGEEFAVVCLGIPLANGVIVSERLRKAIEGHTFTFKDEALTLSISVGVAGVPYDSIHSVEELIGAADKALYQAKDRGKNRTKVYIDP